MKEELQNIPRIIGKYEGDKKGPLLLVTAGVHGNEPSGVLALKEVFAELEKSKPSMAGTFIGVSGNHKALQKGKRFIEEDLNRTWKEKNLQRGEPASHEQKEMFEIIELLKDYSAENFPDRYFVDCHTTSSDSLPYISVQEVGKNDAFAHDFPGYIVRGFSDIVDGSIDKYFSKQGITGFTFEAGQHTAETSQENHEAIIWLALQQACLLKLDKLSRKPDSIEAFKNRFEEGQKTFKIVYRHGIEDDTDFKMQPGFKNFEKISEGQLLAVQDGQEIKSEWNARIFMPLYQAQGNDGFFVIQEAE